MKEKADPVIVAGRAFLKRFGEDCGKRLQEILPEIGLRVHYRNARSYEGALLRMKGTPRGYIVLSRSVREATRQRFTLAHEIGHYLLPDQQDLSQPCGKAQIESWDETLAKPERDANRFAAEILVPRSVMLPYLRESPRFSHVEQIARACQTSLTASAFRFAELSSFRVAMVWSQARRIRWYKASDEFVRWVRKGDLDANSFAFDAFEGKTVPTSFESVPAAAWLFEKGLRPDARILEHSIPLPGYDAVLSLLHIHEPIEDWNDGGGLLDELDPEEFTLRRQTWRGHK
jgi:Zn-dependent peptidase ImmA (M78 family)